MTIFLATTAYQGPSSKQLVQSALIALYLGAAQRLRQGTLPVEDKEAGTPFSRVYSAVHSCLSQTLLS